MKTKSLAVAAAASAVVAAYVYYRYRLRSKAASGMVLRSAYKPSAYQIETVALDFILTEEEAVVKSVVKFAPTNCVGSPLYLDGEDLTLRSIELNGQPLQEVLPHTCMPMVLPHAPGSCCSVALRPGRAAITCSEPRKG